MVTVGDLKKLLKNLRDTDILCCNDMIIQQIGLNHSNEVDNTINIDIFSDVLLSKDNVRKERLRAVGVKVL